MSKGEVAMKGGMIVYQVIDNHNSFELPATAVKAIFKVRGDNYQGFTIVANNHQRKFIPADTPGISSCIDHLAIALNISPEQFAFSTDQTQNVKSRIYFRKAKKNYQILPQSYAKDQDQGYEVIGAKGVFCKWDTTIEQLEKLNVIEKEKIGRTGQNITFAYPVRIGRLLIDGLKVTTTSQREDYPITGFNAKIINSDNTEDSLYETYACIKAGKGKVSKQDRQINERNIQVSLSVAEIHYGFSYVFTNQHQLDLGETTLYIRNKRVYYEYLRVFDDFKNIQLTTCHFYDQKVKLYRKLDNNQLIGITPKGLWPNQNERATIWVDSKKTIIGFSQLEYSYIFALEAIEGFTVSNTRPAKGSGGAGLAVKFKEGAEVVKSWLMFEGAYQSFDDSIQLLEAMSGEDRERVGSGRGGWGGGGGG
ncbi:MAG: hypothetical protein AAGJ93_13780, partial [Bacteroidota bacterium]